MKIYMKKALLTSLITISAVLVGCSSNDNQSIDSSSLQSNTNSNNQVSSITSDNLDFDVDLNKLKERYGNFNITATKGEEGTLSSDGKTYTISVSTTKSAYTISGYFEGRIVINNSSNLTLIKGVKLTLNGACLVSNFGSTIDYQVSEKNVEIVAKKESENYLINISDGYYDSAVNSEKNIEVDGKGILNIITKNGHGLRAENKVRFYDATTINITSGHDAIHTSYFVSNNEEELEVDYEVFEGTVNVLSAVSQAFDCTTSIGTGTIEITSGTYNLSNCESVFKTDVSLFINGQVSATNLSSDPVARGDQSIGVTIEITDTGSFTVDGVDYVKTSI